MPGIETAAKSMGDMVMVVPGQYIPSNSLIEEVSEVIGCGK